MTGAPIRVAFTMISRRNWAGGYNYQRNLFAALHHYCPNRIIPVVFAGERNALADLAQLLRDVLGLAARAAIDDAALSDVRALGTVKAGTRIKVTLVDSE